MLSTWEVHSAILSMNGIGDDHEQVEIGCAVDKVVVQRGYLLKGICQSMTNVVDCQVVKP